MEGARATKVPSDCAKARVQATAMALVSEAGAGPGTPGENSETVTSAAIMRMDAATVPAQLDGIETVKESLTRHSTVKLSSVAPGSCIAKFGVHTTGTGTRRKVHGETASKLASKCKLTGDML